MGGTRPIIASLLMVALAGCAQGGLGLSDGQVFAPGPAGELDRDGLIVGHRLMAAGEFELALRAYSSAAAQQGLNVDTLSALGSVNLKLGRLNQAEELLRQAVEEDAEFAAAWNNLGVLLMEQRKYAEARQVFRRAFATDNGRSDAIRDNLRLAIARTEEQDYGEGNENSLSLVRRGEGDYLLLTTN